MIFQLIGTLHELTHNSITIINFVNNAVKMNCDENSIDVGKYKSKLIGRKVCFYKDYIGFFVRLFKDGEIVNEIKSPRYGPVELTMKDHINPWHITDPDNTIVFRYKVKNCDFTY